MWTEGRSLVYDHALPPPIISHHTPIYFTGLIHDVSLYLQGSLRLRIRREARAFLASSTTITVRHGVLQGVWQCAILPCASGVSCERNTKFLSSRSRCI